MKDIVVDTLSSVAGDGHTSLQEAFKQAVKQSIASGQEVVIHFDHAMNIQIGRTLKVPEGAKVALDGGIEGDNTVEMGLNDVSIRGIGQSGPGSLTLMEVAEGGSLRLADVQLAATYGGAKSGKNGHSGTDGVNGNDGDGEHVPGSSGNGGESVATRGGDGRDAVGGILNFGTVVLDRVNMTGLQAVGGNGGAGGNGGKGGDGGDGSGAAGGSGGPGGSGTGRGGDGGDAAAGVLNYGNLTMMDTWFQTCFVFAGQGGAGGTGGNGGSGGTGTAGGPGGNGGFGGSGGTGGDGATTVLNRGVMTVIGGFVDLPGSNLVWGGSGAGGAAGLGGFGGNGGNGSELDGGHGIGGGSGSAGTAGTSGEVVGWAGSIVNSAFYVESNYTRRDEYGADSGMIQITIYRLGAGTGTGDVRLSLTSDGSGNSIQGGLFSNQLISFAEGESSKTLFFFTRSDSLQSGDASYEFHISDAHGSVLGGNTTADVVIRNSDIVGGSGADKLTGTGRSDVILGGLGNDTLTGKAGNDRLDGQGGIDTADFSAVKAGPGDKGVVVDLAAFSAKGKGIGTDEIFNVEVVIGSAFNDRITGNFSNTLQGGAGDDRLIGSFSGDALIGGIGKDRLVGGTGSGADSLTGGGGLDTLTGGDGADKFIFDTGPLGSLFQNRDHISDFQHQVDDIWLGKTGAGPFDALALGALTAAEFHIGAAATKAGHHIIYTRATGMLYYDPDGVGGVAQVAFAVLDNTPQLGVGDFLVI